MSRGREEIESRKTQSSGNEKEKVRGAGVVKKEAWSGNNLERKSRGYEGEGNTITEVKVKRKTRK